MAGDTWNCCHLGAHSVYTYNHAPVHSVIFFKATYAGCMFCTAHFWKNDHDLVSGHNSSSTTITWKKQQLVQNGKNTWSDTQTSTECYISIASSKICLALELGLIFFWGGFRIRLVLVLNCTPTLLTN